MLMLIDPRASRKIQGAIQSAMKLGLKPTEAMLGDFHRQVAATSSSASGMPRNVSVADGVCEIRIEGVLSKKPDFWSWLFYGANTTYESIRQALALARADEAIKRVSLYVDSPGGYVDGLFDALAALEAFDKPIATRGAYACSAAFGLAAFGGKIEATNVAAEFGSVGVAVEYYWDEHIIQITSTEAPNKRPNPSTPEGVAVIQGELDALHELFADAIARGRTAARGAQVTIEDVNANYGRGGVLLAAAAKKAGMIDRIAKPAVKLTQVTVLPEGSSGAQPAASASAPQQAAEAAPPSPPAPAATATTPAAEPQPSASAAPAAPVPPTNASAASGGAPKQKDNKMDPKTLQSEHPETYAAVLKLGTEQGHAAGVTEGATAERKRVTDHLKLGAASGDPETARKAIESGASVADTQADYLAASMKKGAVDARQQESDGAGQALGGTPPKAPVAKDLEDEVAAELNRIMGASPDKDRA